MSHVFLHRCQLPKTHLESEQWTNAFWTRLGSTAAGDLPVTCTCDPHLPPAFAQPRFPVCHGIGRICSEDLGHRFVDKAG